MEDGSIICIIPIVLFVAIIVISILTSQASKRKKAQISEAYQSQMRNIRGFSPTQFYISVNDVTALGVDENRNLLALFVHNRDDSITYRVISAIDLIGVELFQGGKSASQVRNKAITGALVGSIFGDAGAIIGSNVAGSKAAGDVDNISMILTVNDTQIPNHTIYFRTPSNKNGQAANQARKWLSILEIMVHRAESGQVAPVIQVEAIPPKQMMEEPTDSFALPQSQTQPPASVRCELRSAKSPNSYPIVIDQQTFTIGRAQSNDLILQDATVSRQHAVLSFQNNVWLIQDQASTAGCFVNGKRVEQQRLKNGDQLQIGSTVFIFKTL